MSEAHFDAHGLRTKQGDHADLDRGAVHINGGAEWQDRTRDGFINPKVFFRAGDRHGEGRGRTGGRIGDGLRICDAAHERNEGQAECAFDDQAAIGHNDVDEALEDANDEHAKAKYKKIFDSLEWLHEMLFMRESDKNHVKMLGYREDSNQVQCMVSNVVGLNFLEVNELADSEFLIGD